MSWVKKVLKLAPDAKAELLARMDSWKNAFTGLGLGRDKSTYTLPYLEAQLPAQTLEAIYHSDDVAARAVSAVPDEALREGVVVMHQAAAAAVELFKAKQPNATRKQMQDAIRAAQKSLPASIQARTAELTKDLKNLNAVPKFREAFTWGRLYGLGGIACGFDDGGDPWDPVEAERVRGVDYLTVLDKRDLTPWRWYANFMAPRFGDVAIYLVQPVASYVGMPWDVDNELAPTVTLMHESRMIRFGGELTSRRLKLANQSADYSILQKMFRALQLFNDNWQSGSVLLSDASQAVFKIRGLIDMIAGDAELMSERFSFMDMIRSSFRAILLDAGEEGGAPAEEFTRVQTPFTGIPDMLEISMTRVAAAARMPKIMLFGSAPKGLGDTGDSEIRWWYDTIKSVQTQELQPQFEYLLAMMATAKGWGADADQWTVVFPPLRQQTAKEDAETQQAQSAADRNWAEIGWITPEEGALSRWGTGKFSQEMRIDVESRQRALELRLQTLESEAENERDAADDPAPTPGDMHAQNMQAAKDKAKGSDGPPNASEQ